MRRWPASGCLALAVLGGCARPMAMAAPVSVEAAAPVPAVAAPDSAVSLAGQSSAARDAVAAFIAAEARGDDAADTLLLPGADFIVGGVVITNRPRLAAMIGHGDAALEEVRTGLSGGFAWVVTVYRFTGATPALLERARGTFVLERRPAGWKIRHAHTSMVERW